MTFWTPHVRGIAARVVAAAGGGYVLATMLSIFLSRILPMPQPAAVMTGMLLSFLFYAAAILWVFAARTARLAWLGLLVPAVVFGVLSWVAGPAAVPSLP
jgi:Protein of unknown function (DUF3649)